MGELGGNDYRSMSCQTNLSGNLENERNEKEPCEEALVGMRACEVARVLILGMCLCASVVHLAPLVWPSLHCGKDFNVMSCFSDKVITKCVIQSEVECSASGCVLFVARSSWCSNRNRGSWPASRAVSYVV